ncbi:hypothetical protein ACSFA3_11520 [Variovorax sp. RHLX14]|uniref:hypothetical protein n=1 Tax=Variovorax sp. RHLX14 TaxID=1259731 RepID=UPI003F47D24F
MIKIWCFFSVVLLSLQPDARAADLKSIYFSPTSSQTFNLGPGCRFSATIPRTSSVSARYDSAEPFGSGGLGIDKLSLPQNYWGVDFHCSRSDQDFVNSGWAISDGGRWKLNDNATNRLLLRLKALRFFKIEGIQFNGWVVTYDDTFGDEKFRQRTLSYCVVRLEKAICGESKVGFLESIEKSRRLDLTPYVLEILKSIYFQEDVVPIGSTGLEIKER